MALTKHIFRPKWTLPGFVQMFTEGFDGSETSQSTLLPTFRRRSFPAIFRGP